MLDVTITGWAATVGLVLGLLAIDLTLAITSRPHQVGFREAVAWSIFYIAVAIGLRARVRLDRGLRGSGGEYFAGYIVEKSLSVDNLFVFVVIMTSFAVPAEHQQKVLIVGIVLALVLRVIFIALGAALLDAVLVHVPYLRPAADRHRHPALSPPRAGPHRRGQRRS